MTRPDDLILAGFTTGSVAVLAGAFTAALWLFLAGAVLVVAAVAAGVWAERA